MRILHRLEVIEGTVHSYSPSLGVFGSIAGAGAIWAGVYGGSWYYSLIGLALLYLGLSAPIKYFRADKVKLFKYKCVGCGHQWEQREDEEGGPVAAISKPTNQEPH